MNDSHKLSFWVNFGDFGSCKKKRNICKFDTTLRGRNEVQKNKLTPHYQTEFDGESEKNNRFAPRELLF
jgi:hypothetical protein